MNSPKYDAFNLNMIKEGFNICYSFGVCWILPEQGLSHLEIGSYLFAFGYVFDLFVNQLTRSIIII